MRNIAETQLEGQPTFQEPFADTSLQWMEAEPLKGATPRRGVWRRSRPLPPAGTSATAASDLAVFLNGVSLFVGEARGAR